MNYTIKIEQLKPNNEEETNQIESKYIAIEVNEGQKEILGDYTKGRSTYEGEEYESIEAREIVKGTIEGKGTKEYKIRLWMDESVEATEETMNKSFISKIVVDGNLNELAEYNEPILHGTDPVLKEELVPVVIDDTGKVTKANTKEEWYNYEEKRWANAVILTNNKTADNYKEGEQILESDIESYFVWIPRYNYKLFNTTNFTYTASTEGEVASPQIIEVRFGTKETNDKNKNECTTPGESGNIGNCNNGDWMTHPAFLAFPNTKGLWVGKFETGYKGATSTTTAQHNINNSKQVIIKPNVYSWRSIQVSNAYQTSFGYKRELESHMMKNTEWGAVAYLQQSLYGSHESVRINNNRAYLTGYAAVNKPTCGYTATNETCNKYEEVNLGTGMNAQDGTYTLNYFNSKSVSASTTGNYYGIYDMSGGSVEYMMAVMVDENGKPSSGRNSLYNSGFNGTLTCPNCAEGTLKPDGTTEVKDGIDFPRESKYYDTYKYSKSANDYTNGILGDASSEMGPFKNAVYTPTNGEEAQTRHISGWYDEDILPIIYGFPWIMRGLGTSHGIGAGIFSLDRAYGNLSNVRSFRIVLAL